MVESLAGILQQEFKVRNHILVIHLAIVGHHDPAGRVHQVPGAAVAAALGIDDIRANVLPEDKKALVDELKANEDLAGYAPLALGVALLMAIEMVQLIWLGRREGGATTGFQPYPEDYNNTEALGSVLYTEHVYAFEIAAVILLLAIVAAITLTMRKRPGLKVQDIASQVAVRAKDRIRIVKMDAEKKS